MPMEFTVNAEDYTGIADVLESYPRRARDVIANAMQQLGERITPFLVANTPVGTSGDLATKTRAVVHILGTEISLRVDQPATNPWDGLMYQDWVEAGRSPGSMPPPHVLVDWVEQKWGLSPGPDAESGAFRLARHIAGFGTQSNDYVIRTLVENKELIDSLAVHLGINLSITVWNPNINSLADL